MMTGKRSNNVPEMVSRFYGRMGTLGIAMGMICLVPIILRRPLGIPRTITLGRLEFETMMVFVLLSVALAVIWLVSIVLWELRWSRRAREHGYRLCLRCGHSLEGVEKPVCPECGTPSDLREADRRWRDFRPRITGFFPRPVDRS
jgi:ribosomal protein L37E